MQKKKKSVRNYNGKTNFSENYFFSSEKYNAYFRIRLSLDGEKHVDPLSQMRWKRTWLIAKSISMDINLIQYLQYKPLKYCLHVRFPVLGFRSSSLLRRTAFEKMKVWRERMDVSYTSTIHKCLFFLLTYSKIRWHKIMVILLMFHCVFYFS